MAMVHNQPQYVIRSGVLYVREWEWSSDDAILLGYTVHTVVRETKPLSPTERTAPDFHVTFANGWVFGLALAFAATPSPGEFVSDLAFATVYRGDGPVITELSSIQTIPFVTAKDFIAVIRDIAGREPLDVTGRQATETNDEDVEALIATLNRHSEAIMQGRVFTGDSAQTIREMREERDAGLTSA